MDIRDNISPNSFYQGFDEPTGYGAFDEDQLNERTEDVTEEDLCEYCGLRPEKCDCYSCCGDLLDPDIRICPTCKEHC